MGAECGVSAVLRMRGPQAEVLQWDYFRQVAFVSAKDIKVGVHSFPLPLPLPIPTPSLT